MYYTHLGKILVKCGFILDGFGFIMLCIMVRGSTLIRAVRKTVYVDNLMFDITLSALLNTNNPHHVLYCTCEWVCCGRVIVMCCDVHVKGRVDG